MQTSGRSQAMADALIAAATVVGLVVVLIGGATLLTPPDVLGAGMPRPMLIPFLIFAAAMTIGLGLMVGALRFFLWERRWGGPVAVLIGVMGVAFIAFAAWANCLIPHEYCSSIP